MPSTSEGNVLVHVLQSLVEHLIPSQSPWSTGALSSYYKHVPSHVCGPNPMLWATPKLKLWASASDMVLTMPHSVPCQSLKEQKPFPSGRNFTSSIWFRQVRWVFTVVIGALLTAYCTPSTFTHRSVTLVRQHCWLPSCFSRQDQRRKVVTQKSQS